MKIIGLMGPEGSGKTTAASKLADRCNIVTLADPVKDACARALGVSLEELEVMKREGSLVLGKPCREFIINVAEGFRVRDPLIFCKIAHSQMREARVNVISDLRFDHEISYFDAIGSPFHIVRISHYYENQVQYGAGETCIRYADFGFLDEAISREASIMEVRS